MNTSQSARVVALLACLPIMLAACGKTEITREPVGAGGTDAGLSCPEALPGAKLIAVSDAKGGTYCIDQREVTNADYKQFVDAVGKVPAKQPKGCNLNDSYLPKIVQEDTTEAGTCHAVYWKYDTEPDLPMICVDFCDAWSYCQWAGKRLCGVVGAGTAEPNFIDDIALDSIAVSTSSEWFNACSQGGTTKYPYGDTYAPGVCIDEVKVADAGKSLQAVSDVSKSACHGGAPPFDAIYDLSGSVDEWQNICRTSGCVAQGGGIANASSSDLSCAGGMGVSSRVALSPFRGFRCCADAVPGDGG